MNDASRRFASVWLRRLSTDRIERRNERHLSARDETPRLVVEPVRQALRVCALNEAASALGLKPGMPMADARAMFPAIVVHDADRDADHALLNAVADWCDRFTPLVGLDAPDGLLLDISGCAHLFGGERGLREALLSGLMRQGFHAAVGIGDTAAGAWAAARFGRVPVVAKGAMREYLMPLPLAALRLDGETLTRLAQSGLNSIRDIAERPRAPLTARFGAAMLHRLDAALGLTGETITPRLPLPRYVVERRFADPIGLEADVLGTVGQLARELCHLMERRGEGARLLQVALFRTDGQVYRIEAGTAEALCHAGRIERLFVERLAVVGDECDPGFGYDMVRLSALQTEPRNPAQSDFVEGGQQAEVGHLVDRLSARFGAERLTQMVLCDTHIPERAVVSLPAQRGAGEFGDTLPWQESLALTRPLRLLKYPEMVEAIAEVPDGPPIRFRWRRVMHDVARCEGPERISMEWWRDAEASALPRDYFRVESHQGLRLWLYREGFYTPTNRFPRWFLHGLFA